jgi:hypothetical protein
VERGTNPKERCGSQSEQCSKAYLDWGNCGGSKQRLALRCDIRQGVKTSPR